MGCRRPRGSVVRCPGCRLLPAICICAALGAPLPARTRVVVLMHASEPGKPTNTGRLLPRLLASAELRLRGASGVELSLDDLRDPARRTWLLDPDGPDELTPAIVAEDPRPVTLVLSDGTWRKARRAVTRLQALRGLRRVRLAPGPPGRYRLRDAGSPDKLATLEAAARALGVLEGPEVQARLEEVFDLLVARTLQARGSSA
jgi:DTW domain-containing protein YfiP